MTIQEVGITIHQSLKSWLMHHGAVAIAAGVPRFMQEHFGVSERGWVLLLTGEGGVDLVQYRIRHLCEGMYGVDFDDVAERIIVSSDIAPMTSRARASLAAQLNRRSLRDASVVADERVVTVTVAGSVDFTLLGLVERGGRFDVTVRATAEPCASAWKSDNGLSQPACHWALGRPLDVHRTPRRPPLISELQVPVHAGSLSRPRRWDRFGDSSTSGSRSFLRGSFVASMRAASATPSPSTVRSLSHAGRIGHWEVGR